MRLEHTMKRTLLSSLVLGPALLLAALLIPASGGGRRADHVDRLHGADAEPAARHLQPVGRDRHPRAARHLGPDLGLRSTTARRPSPSVPGPVLVANAGDTVTVNLTNNLPPADVASCSTARRWSRTRPAWPPAAATGPTRSRPPPPAPTSTRPGSSPGSQYQVAMGLYGVAGRPAGRTPAQAYDDPLDRLRRRGPRRPRRDRPA